MMVQQTIDFEKSYDYIVIIRDKYLKLDFNSNLNELQYLYKKILKRMEK